MTPLRTAVVALLGLVLLLTAPLAAGDKKAPARPTKEAAEARGKAGFELGWYGIDSKGALAFHPEAGGLTEAMPAFWPASSLERLPKPPDPKAPFALALSRTELTDAGLKELKPLENLTTLYLEGTKVTDRGVKEPRKALPSGKIEK